MLRPKAWRVACVVGLLASCEDRAPVPRLLAISPARGHTDRALRVRLIGEQFFPAYDLDLSSGTRTGDAGEFRGAVGTLGPGTTPAALIDFGWVGPGELTATLTPGLVPGTHAVSVIDPRGAHTVLPAAFLSLGEDRQPPAVTVHRPAPGEVTAPGARLRVQLSVEDPSGLEAARWEVRGQGGRLAAGLCLADPDPDPGPRAVDCGSELLVPEDLPAGGQVELVVQATDEAAHRNVGTATRSVVVSPAPVLLAVSPIRGGTAGGTEVVVRGSGFPPGSRVYFGRGLLQPDGGIRLDAETITGRTPAHPQGGALVRVQTPLGDARLAGVQSLFTFEPPPVLRAVQPPMILPSGGTALRVQGENFTPRTRLLVGPSQRAAVLLADQVVHSTTEIQATSLPGEGRTNLYAVDPDIGSSTLEGALTFTTPGAP